MLHLQDEIYEKDEEIAREKELNRRLLAKLTQDNKTHHEHERTVEELCRSVGVLSSCVKNLSREVKAVKSMLHKGPMRFEGIQEETVSSESDGTQRRRETSESLEHSAGAVLSHSDHAQCTCLTRVKLEKTPNENFEREISENKSENPEPLDHDTLEHENNQIIPQHRHVTDGNHGIEDHVNKEMRHETNQPTRPPEKKSRWFKCRCCLVYFVRFVLFAAVVCLALCFCKFGDCFNYYLRFSGNHVSKEIPETCGYMTWILELVRRLVIFNLS